jgi:hypothetical protein
MDRRLGLATNAAGGVGVGGNEGKWRVTDVVVGLLFHKINTVLIVGSLNSLPLARLCVHCVAVKVHRLIFLLSRHQELPDETREKSACGSHMSNNEEEELEVVPESVAATKSIFVRWLHAHGVTPLRESTVGRDRNQ